MAHSRVALALLVLASGCKRDPVFVGYWDLAKVERDGVSQSDVGFLDFDGDGNVTFFSRYLHDGAGWLPDPQPATETSVCNVYEQDDVFDAYQEEGEVYTLYIARLSADAMRLVDYHPWRAEVKGGALLWPGSEEALPTTLVLRR